MTEYLSFFEKLADRAKEASLSPDDESVYLSLCLKRAIEATTYLLSVEFEGKQAIQEKVGQLLVNWVERKLQLFKLEPRRVIKTFGYGEFEVIEWNVNADHPINEAFKQLRAG